MIDNQIFNAIFKVNHAGGSGSCFYLKKYNLFVTNFHVVDGFHRVAIQDNDFNSLFATVVLVNPAIDLALLYVEGDFSLLPDIELSSSDKLQIGQKIFVAGYPFGMPFTVTSGVVSSPRQLLDGSYYIQTDAAVNPGNSGGPMFNEQGELVAITVSKLTDADNMGFGIPVLTLKSLLTHLPKLDERHYHLQCSSCDELLTSKQEFCPVCGNPLPMEVFDERDLTELATFCEDAISQLGINPVLARVGYEAWKFHSGSAEVRISVYEGSYLFCTSPINVLPKKNLEPLFTYLVEPHHIPFKMGLDKNLIVLSYRIHITDLFSQRSDKIKHHIVDFAHTADKIDDFLVSEFGCDYSEYTKRNNV